MINIRGDAACDLTGIPPLHAEAFHEVANREKCMIASRAVGKFATQLILEGYSSKGFHNKAKSCNWGPMAGFVLTDPRFTKAGETPKGRANQTESLEKAFEAGATTVPLIISEDRRRWLAREGLIRITQNTPDRVLCEAASPWGLVMKFALVKPSSGMAPPDTWGVCYEASMQDQGLEWVMAVRDPLCSISMQDYRSATTGDYDLFAIYVPSESYRPDTADRRMVSHANLERNIKAKATDLGEDQHLGNITPRIMRVRDGLNTAISRRGYTGGNMVHHSDEGGRPFVDDVDLPVFAVVPGDPSAYGIESVEDLREFIGVTLGEQFAPVFNPGWMKQLVFHSKLADARRIHSVVAKNQLHKQLLANRPQQH